MIKKIAEKSIINLFTLLIICSNFMCMNSKDLITSFIPMTCSQNLYTQYHHILFPEESFCEVDFSLTYRYIASHNASQIATALWGDQNLLFAGQNIKGKSSNALVAEYFGMGPRTELNISLSPNIENQISDIQFALSGKHWWVQVNFPIMYANWMLTKKCRNIPATGFYDANKIDGSNISLLYDVPIAGLVAPTAISYPVFINNIALQEGNDGSGNNNIWFDNSSSSMLDGSFVGMLENSDVLNFNKSEIEIKDLSVSSIHTIDSAFNKENVVSVKNRYYSNWFIWKI